MKVSGIILGLCLAFSATISRADEYDEAIDFAQTSPACMSAMTDLQAAQAKLSMARMQLQATEFSRSELMEQLRILDQQKQLLSATIAGLLSQINSPFSTQQQKMEAQMRLNQARMQLSACEGDIARLSNELSIVDLQLELARQAVIAATAEVNAAQNRVNNFCAP